MSLDALLSVAVRGSIILIVLGIGLNATRRDVSYLARHPGLLLRSILAMNVVMPLVAVTIAVAFDLPRAVKFAMVTLSMSIVLPMISIEAAKFGGTAAYVLGLFVAASFVAIVAIPVSVWLLSQYLGVAYRVPEGIVVRLVVVSVLAPLVAGIAIRHFAPSTADRVATLVLRVAPIVLVVGIVPQVIELWPAVCSLIGNGTVLAFAGYAALALIVGHVLGGPDRSNRTVLALATESRHPIVALALATANFPDRRMVVAATVLALLVNAVASVLYGLWVVKLAPVRK
jgi:predicted Na+-dependent transporter